MKELVTFRKYLNEGIINEEFSSRGYQISTVEPDHLEQGDGFLPLIFDDFDYVDSNNLDSVKDFIQDSIYSTFSFRIDDIYEEIEKSFKSNLQKMEDDYKDGKLTDDEANDIENKILDKKDIFDKSEEVDLVKIQMERGGGTFSVTDPITGEVEISGKFNIF